MKNVKVVFYALVVIISFQQLPAKAKDLKNLAEKRAYEDLDKLNKESSRLLPVLESAENKQVKTSSLAIRFNKSKVGIACSRLDKISTSLERYLAPAGNSTFLHVQDQLQKDCQQYSEATTEEAQKTALKNLKITISYLAATAPASYYLKQKYFISQVRELTPPPEFEDPGASGSADQ
jgi:hypothetical protein